RPLGGGHEIAPVMKQLLVLSCGRGPYGSLDLTEPCVRQTPLGGLVLRECACRQGSKSTAVCETRCQLQTPTSVPIPPRIGMNPEADLGSLRADIEERQGAHEPVRLGVGK